MQNDLNNMSFLLQSSTVVNLLFWWKRLNLYNKHERNDNFLLYNNFILITYVLCHCIQDCRAFQNWR